MKMFAIALFTFSIPAFADTPTPTAPAPNGQFEVIDVSGQVVGEPAASSKDARGTWTKSCATWKTEMQDMNKAEGNQTLAMNCNSPSCNLLDASQWQCTSMGTYKVKTAGQRVVLQTPPQPQAYPEPPVAPVIAQPITVAPPPVIYEAAPAPRVGFIWIGGYWGWYGARHIWYPGRWAADRPGYMWVHPAWTPHPAGGWRFAPGRWQRR